MTDAPPAQPRTERPHLEVLDGVRGLAILLVMQYHFYGFAFGILGDNPTLALDRWTMRIVGVGWSGVDLFFVLSGFLITGILYDAKHSSQRYFRIFYARRILRIFPLYYAFLLFVLFVLPYLRPFDGPAAIGQLRDNQVWYWTYLVNVASTFKGLNAEIPSAHGQFWSLAVEEQFYLVWPLAVLVLARRNLMVLCALLIIVAFGIRIALAEYITTTQLGYNASHVLLPTRMDTLAIGAFLALAARGGADELRRCALAAPYVAACAIGALLAIFLAEDGLSIFDPPVETVGFSALAALFASILVLAVTSQPGGAFHRIFSQPLLMFFGRYAYALYVFHLLVGFELGIRFDTIHSPQRVFGSQIPTNIAFSLVCTGVSVGLAWLSWHLFEKQVLKLKRFFPYTPRPVAQPARDAEIVPRFAAP